MTNNVIKKYVVKFINSSVSCAFLTFRNYTLVSSSSFRHRKCCGEKRNRMNFKPVTHVLFDLDGTLLDTETINTHVFEDIAKTYGKEYTEDIRDLLLGTIAEETCRIFIKELGLKDVLTEEQFLRDYDEQSKKALPGVPMMPGAKRLIEHLHENNVPFALATSSSAESVKLKTAHLKDVFCKFRHMVMAGSDPEVKHGKPAPDIYLIAAARFCPPADPEKCLVFEDAPNGAIGSIKANMQVVALRDPVIPKDRFPIETTLFLDSLEDFNPEDFGLPPYN